MQQLEIEPWRSEIVSRVEERREANSVIFGYRRSPTSNTFLITFMKSLEIQCSSNSCFCMHRSVLSYARVILLLQMRHKWSERQIQIGVLFPVSKGRQFYIPNRLAYLE